MPLTKMAQCLYLGGHCFIHRRKTYNLVRCYFVAPHAYAGHAFSVRTVVSNPKCAKRPESFGYLPTSARSATIMSALPNKDMECSNKDSRNNFAKPARHLLWLLLIVCDLTIPSLAAILPNGNTAYRRNGSLNL